MTFASLDDMTDFWGRAVAVLDCQEIRLESLEAKYAAVQAVQRVLRDIAIEKGEDVALGIIKFPRKVILPQI